MPDVTRCHVAGCEGKVHLNACKHAPQVLDAKISVRQKLDILVCCFGLRKVRAPAHGLQDAPRHITVGAVGVAACTVSSCWLGKLAAVCTELYATTP
jgi:hypothetical protein